MMATLSKRATPAQTQLFRIIEGAVKNATDAHPGWDIDPRFASSIAKRAVGTVTAVWPELLAAMPFSGGQPSDVAGEHLHTPGEHGAALRCKTEPAPAQTITICAGDAPEKGCTVK